MSAESQCQGSLCPFLLMSPSVITQCGRDEGIYCAVWEGAVCVWLKWKWG